MTLYVGQLWTKLTSNRTAQVTALDQHYAYMYWPDRDQCTAVRINRFDRTTEWKPTC